MKKVKMTLRIFAKDIGIVFGLVLVWRGIWYFFDELDVLLFDGSHVESAVLGVIIGLLLLYLPDGDLKEIEKL